MPTKVFYAWQSDVDEKVNHYLIRDAIQDAIKELAADAEVEEAPEIDHDTKDVPGTPDIANTISEKIKAAGAFIADVTGVTSYTTHDDRPKQTPNANVMIELGMAIRRIKWKRILLVMNTAFADVDKLPFDLKNRSRPMTYHLAAGAPKSDRDAAQKVLASKLKQKLKLIMASITSDTTKKPVESPTVKVSCKMAVVAVPGPVRRVHGFFSINVVNEGERPVTVDQAALIFSDGRQLIPAQTKLFGMWKLPIKLQETDTVSIMVQSEDIREQLAQARRDGEPITLKFAVVKDTTGKAYVSEALDDYAEREFDPVPAT